MSTSDSEMAGILSKKPPGEWAQRDLAQKQSCLFVGRCTNYILRDFPRCVNVFISATKEDRINSIMKNHQLSAEKAEETSLIRRPFCFASTPIVALSASLSVIYLGTAA